MRRLLLLSTMLCLPAMAKTTLEDRLDGLERDNQDLRKKIKKLEETTVESGIFPGSFKISGTNTSIGLNGFIKLDMLHDADGVQTGYAYDFLLVSFAPLQNAINLTSQRKGVTHFSARYSRFVFQTETPTNCGDLLSYLEADFFGGTATPTSTEVYNNNYDLRLRQAYIKWGRVLVGQTSTTFYDPQAVVETLNPAIATSIGANRQPMLRYIHPFEPDDKMALAVALENPESDYTDDTATKHYTYPADQATASRFNGLDRFPDFAARFYVNRPWGGLSLRGLVREIRIVDPNKASLSKTGYAVGIGAHYIPFGHDKISLQIQGGRAVGRYMLDSAGQAAFYNSVKRELFLQNSVGGMVGYTHYWAENWRSSLTGGIVRVYNNDFLKNINKATFPDVNRRMYTASANLLCTPIENMDVGLEFIRGARFTEDGRRGRMTRIQLSLKYIFGKPHRAHSDAGGA